MASLGCWHAYRVGISAVLTLAPGCSPGGSGRRMACIPAHVTDGDGRAGYDARDPPYSARMRDLSAIAT